MQTTTKPNGLGPNLLHQNPTYYYSSYFKVNENPTIMAKMLISLDKLYHLKKPLRHRRNLFDCGNLEQGNEKSAYLATGFPGAPVARVRL